MARLDTPVASDDEFDLLYDAESSSDQDDRQKLGPQIPASAYTNYANAERLSGPHEVPVLPREEDVAAVARQLDDHHLADGIGPSRTPTISGSPSLRRSASVKGKGNNLVNDGLQYTKSVYNKWLSKDALIAVMG